MPDRVRLDKIDHTILDRLRANARESAASIAREVDLTPGAVRRRIARLEDSQVIAGYTIAINHDKLDSTIEAYIELSFSGNPDVHAVLRDAMHRPEVREALTIAGEHDAVVRVRVRDLPELRQTVMALRALLPVNGTTTRIILGRWWHGGDSQTDVLEESPGVGQQAAE